MSVNTISNIDSVSNTLLIQQIEKSNVSEETALTLQNSFEGFFIQAEKWSQQAKELEVTDATQLDKIKGARELRLKLKKYRVQVERKRKELKEDSLKKGRAIDQVAKIIKSTLQKTEEFLQLQEDFAKIQEEKLHAERMLQLKEYQEYVNIDYKNLGILPQEEFDNVLEETKAAYDYQVEQLRLEEIRKAEEAKARAEEDKRIREENKRLREEARRAEEEALKEKERAAAEQRKKLEAQHQLEAEKSARQKLEAEKLEAESRRLREVQEQLAREQQLRAREEAIKAAEAKKLEQLSREADEAVMKLEEQFLAIETDEEKLMNVLKTLKSISVEDLSDQFSQKLWKKTAIQINAAIKTLERGIEKL